MPFWTKSRPPSPQAAPLSREHAASTGQAPGWNFHKYLIARDGRAVGSYSSDVAPGNPRLVAAVEQALSAP